MDEMERAHRNDYEYEKKLREAREAVCAVLNANRLGKQSEAELKAAVYRLTEEMDHIVARWN